MNPRVLYLASQVVNYLKLLNTPFEACHLMTLERKPISAEQSDKIKPSTAGCKNQLNGSREASAYSLGRPCSEPNILEVSRKLFF